MSFLLDDWQGDRAWFKLCARLGETVQGGSAFHDPSQQSVDLLRFVSYCPVGSSDYLFSEKR